MSSSTLHYIQCPECDSDIRVSAAAQWIHCVKCGHDFHNTDELTD